MTQTRIKSPDFVISSSSCPHYLGFLSQRPKGAAVPDGCLTCERIFDCMATKPEGAVAKPEIMPEVSAAEKTKDLAEEFKEKNKEEGSEEGKVRHNDEAGKLTKRASNNDFTIESPGMLYAHWSSTVLIRKETLHNWGKVKEVSIETGKVKMTCKVYPVEDLEIGVIQVPDKMQLKLGVKKGGIVRVKPAVKS